MATGYTMDIEKGISFKQFAMGCAKAFGACISMRDEPIGKPIPKEFKPTTHHEKRTEEINKELVKVKKMPVVEAGWSADKEYLAKVKSNQQSITKNNKLLERYKAMLVKVEAWEPPSSDHKGLKDFMREQIESSMNFDCNNEYCEKYKPKVLTGEEWLHQKIQELQKDLSYHQKEDKEEKERTDGRNRWVSQLRESL